MKNIVYKFIIVMIFIGSLFAEKYVGTIFSDDNEKFETTGTVTQKGDYFYKDAIFIDGENNIIINEKAKFKTNPFELLEISITDKRNGRKEIVSKSNEVFLLKYQKETDSNIKTKIIDEDGILMHGSVLIMYIADEFDQLLLMNQPVKMKMLVPLRQTYYNFELTREETQTVYDKECYVFKLEASSWLVNALTQPSYFYFTKDYPHKIIKYSGSTLITDENENQVCGEMKIVYE